MMLLVSMLVVEANKLVIGICDNSSRASSIRTSPIGLSICCSLVEGVFVSFVDERSGTSNCSSELHVRQ